MQAAMSRREKPNFTVLVQYKASIIGACLVVGNFNTFLWSWKKEGGMYMGINQASTFRCFLTDFTLCDMGFSGDTFTWNNRCSGSQNVRIRLDRALAIYDLLNLYSSVTVSHLDDLGSDHHPLLVNLDPNLPKSRKFFRFDAG